MSPRRGSTVLVTVLFTDIVGSTEIAAEVGHRRWRNLVQRHHAAVRRELKRFGGKELRTMNATYTIGRIFLSLLFIVAGVQKLMNVSGIAKMLVARAR